MDKDTRKRLLPATRSPVIKGNTDFRKGVGEALAYSRQKGFVLLHHKAGHRLMITPKICLGNGISGGEKGPNISKSWDVPRRWFGAKEVGEVGEVACP